MKAFLLAAGEGTRLRPLTLTLPKPMVPLANVPLLTRTLQLLGRQNVTEIAVNLFHRPDAIERVLGDGAGLGVHLHYSHEPQLLGTAGGVKKMEAFLDTPFLVLYGDNLYDADFAPLIDFHRETDALATLATFTAPNPSACGLIETTPNGCVTRFVEKPPPHEVFTDQANAGVYVIAPRVLAHIPPDTFFDWGRDVFPRLLEQAPGRVFARPLNGYLQDTGTIGAYRQANWDILEGRAGTKESGISDSAQVAGAAILSGRNVVGANCILSPGSISDETIYWDNCVVGENAHITGAILGSGVHVGAGARIGNGAVLAGGASVEAGATVPPDARIGPNERVFASV